MFKECLGSNYTSREGSLKTRNPGIKIMALGWKREKKRRVCKQKQEKEL